MTLTVHHVRMALAHKLSKKHAGKKLALLVTPKGEMYSATDESTAYPGHTAVVNLVQNLYREPSSRELLTNAMVYCTYYPSTADLGMFIEHVRQQNDRRKKLEGEVRLFYSGKETSEPFHEILVATRPTKLLNPLINEKGRMSLPRPLSNWSGGWKDFKNTPLSEIEIDTSDDAAIRDLLNDRKQTVSAVKHFDSIVTYEMGTKDSAPKFTSDTPPGLLTYKQLSKESRKLFNDAFMLAAYSLASPIHEPLETTKHKGKVGAVLVSPRGEILSWGVDFDYALHAETTTVKLFQKQYGNVQLPANSRLYTSLEPCFMCSGLLDSAYRGSEGFKIICGQTDPAVHQQGGAHTFLKPEVDSPIAERASKTMYGQRQGTFKSRLDDKAKELASWSPTAKNKYEKSVMNQMDVPTFNRRLAKATLQLAQLSYEIAKVESPAEKEFLTRVWLNALGVVCVYADVLPDDLLRKTASYLDESRGKNEERSKKTESGYASRISQRQNEPRFEQTVTELLARKPDLGL